MLEEAIICLSIFVGGFFILPENIQKLIFSKRYILYTSIISIILYGLSVFIFKSLKKKKKENFDISTGCGPSSIRCDKPTPYCLVTELALPTNDMDQTIVFNTYGRYVKIFPPESTSQEGWVNFSALQIFDQTGTNILPGKTAVTGSSHSDSTNPSGQAYKVGNSGTTIRFWPDVFHSTSLDRNTPVWTVDLGRIYMITKIRYIGRGDCCSTSHVAQKGDPARNVGVRFRIYSNPTDVPTKGRCTEVPTVEYPTGTTEDEKMIIRPVILKGIDGGMALNMYRGIQSNPDATLASYGLSDEKAAKGYALMQTKNNRLAFTGWLITGTWDKGSTKISVTAGCMPIVGQTVYMSDPITVYVKTPVDMQANCHYGYLYGDGVDGYKKLHRRVFATVPTPNLSVLSEYKLQTELLKQTITSRSPQGVSQIGRFIRIRPSLSSGDGTMQISQIVVKNGNTIISKGKPVRDTSKNTTLLGANLSTIVDGTAATRSWPDVWISNTTDRANEYIEIDLETTQLITTIEFYGREDGFTERNEGLRFEILDYFQYQRVYIIQDGPLVKFISEDSQFAKSTTGNADSVDLTQVHTYDDQYGKYKYVANPSHTDCSSGGSAGSGNDRATSNAQKVYGITAGAKVTAITGKTFTIDKPTIAAGNNIVVKFNGYIDRAELDRLNRLLQPIKKMSDYPGSFNLGNVIRTFKSHNTAIGTTYVTDIDGNIIPNPDPRSGSGPISIPSVDDGSKSALYTILNVSAPVSVDPSAGYGGAVNTLTEAERTDKYVLPAAVDSTNWVATALTSITTPGANVSNPHATKKTYEKNDQLDITGKNTFDSSQQDLSDAYELSLATPASSGNVAPSQNQRTVGNRTQYAEIMLLGDSTTFDTKAKAQAACEAILGTLVTVAELTTEFENMSPYLKRPQWHEYGFLSDSDQKYLVTQETTMERPLDLGTWNWTAPSGQGAINGSTNVTRYGGLITADISTGGAICKAIKPSLHPQAKSADTSDIIQEVKMKKKGRYVRIWPPRVGYVVRDSVNKNPGEACPSGYSAAHETSTKKYCIKDTCPDSSYVGVSWLKTICVQQDTIDTICLSQVIVKDKTGLNISYQKYDAVTIAGINGVGTFANVVNGVERVGTGEFISEKYLACPPQTTKDTFTKFGDGSQGTKRCQEDIYWQLDLGTSTYVSTVTIMGCTGRSIKGLRVEIADYVRPRPYNDSAKSFAWNDKSAFDPACNSPLTSKICVDPTTKVPELKCVYAQGSMNRCPGDCDKGNNWCAAKCRCIPDMSDQAYWQRQREDRIDITSCIQSDGWFNQTLYDLKVAEARLLAIKDQAEHTGMGIGNELWPSNCEGTDKKSCADYVKEGDVWGNDCWDDGTSLWHKTQPDVCGDACWLGWDPCRRRAAAWVGGGCIGGCKESCSPVGIIWKTMEQRETCKSKQRTLHRAPKYLWVQKCCVMLRPEKCCTPGTAGCEGKGQCPGQ